MAILWQKTIRDIHYEVRGAGSTRRLYTNGVFHTQYKPQHMLTGGVWDLLMLPALFYPPGKIKHVLVLGVGGGAVLRMLKTFVAPETIVGVEMSQTHLTLARRYFGVGGKSIKLVRAEAVNWLQSYTGPPFDMIIDDLFMEHNGEAVRAVSLNNDWFKLLLNNLLSHGVIVANTISTAEWKQSAYMTNKAIAKQFRSACKFTLPTYANTIVALFKKPVTRRHLSERVAEIQSHVCQKAIRKLPYRLRLLKQ